MKYIMVNYKDNWFSIRLEYPLEIKPNPKTGGSILCFKKRDFYIDNPPKEVMRLIEQAENFKYGKSIYDNN